ncbi:hypothetical protein EON77_19470, partial [bacterium]
MSIGDIDGDGDADEVDRLLQLPSAPANSYTGANAGVSYTPANDPIAGADANKDQKFFEDPYGSINARFNKIWIDAQKGYNNVPSAFAERGVAHRFIDLRLTPTSVTTANPVGVLSPLDPRQGFTRARIVPGSEEVFGPDMSPGPNYGVEIRYRRTTRDVPGPNEYRINYVDLQAPGTTDALGNFVEDYSQSLGLPAGSAVPPATYKPTDFVSAVVQPRYKAGYLVLCSEPNVPIPAETFVRDPS